MKSGAKSQLRWPAGWQGSRAPESCTSTAHNCRVFQSLFGTVYGRRPPAHAHCFNRASRGHVPTALTRVSICRASSERRVRVCTIQRTGGGGGLARALLSCVSSCCARRARKTEWRPFCHSPMPAVSDSVSSLDTLLTRRPAIRPWPELADHALASSELTRGPNSARWGSSRPRWGCPEAQAGSGGRA